MLHLNGTCINLNLPEAILLSLSRMRALFSGCFQQSTNVTQNYQLSPLLQVDIRASMCRTSSFREAGLKLQESIAPLSRNRGGGFLLRASGSKQPAPEEMPHVGIPLL